MADYINLKYFLLFLQSYFLINGMLIIEFLRWCVNLFIPTRYKKINGKLALVTGGANGIGKAIALELASKGCNIAIADIDIETAEKTVGEIIATHQVKAKAFKADVSCAKAVLQLKADIESSLGFVDLLVNNAGVLAFNLSLREKSPEDVQKIIQINLMSHFWTVRAFLDGMIERKYGHIIAVGSIAGKVSFPYSVTYCTSKFGVTGFMSALYDELIIFKHDDYIKTTTIYPSFVNTCPQMQEMLEGVPLMKPETVAKEAVAGILKNQRNIYIPRILKATIKMDSLPERIIKTLKLKGTTAENIEKRKLYMESV